jgi:hypothetical protein
MRVLSPRVLYLRQHGQQRQVFGKQAQRSAAFFERPRGFVQLEAGGGRRLIHTG